MITSSQYFLSALAITSLLALSACASHAPRVSNAALGFAVTTYAIAADGNEQALSSALGSALSGAGLATAMTAKADITIDFVRYNSPILGFFYGGQHHANLSVILSDNSGTKITSFSLYVAANGGRSSADADLAAAAKQIIVANAANAYLPIKAFAKAASQPITKPDSVPVIAIPSISVPAIDAPVDDIAAPCVIGPDGRCLIF